MIKTFINHASEDHHFVFWLNDRLKKEELGLDIFIDDDRVSGGDQAIKMIEAVKASIIFLPIISDYSTQKEKEFIRNEIEVALDTDATNIFPILYKCSKENIPEKIKIKFINPESPEGILYFDFSNEKEWEVIFDDLRSALLSRIIELGLFRNTDRDFYKDCEHIDIILKRAQPTSSEIKTMVDVYLPREKYQRYIFTRLDKIEWLKWLDIYGFLKSNPPLEEDKESPGTFMIPHWYALDYLEKVSKKVAESNDVENIKRILNIIEKVSFQKDKNGKVIDNFHTWRNFVKILSILPNENIQMKHIKLIPIWLDSRFNNDLTGYEITKSLLPKFLNSEEPSDSKKIEKIMSIITNIKEVPFSEERSKLYGKKTEEKLIIDSYALEDLLKKHSDKIAEKCSIRLIIDFMLKVKSLIKKKESFISFDKSEIAIKLQDDGLKYKINILEVEEEDDKELFENLFRKRDINGKLLKLIEVKKINRLCFIEELCKIIRPLDIFKDIDSKVIEEKLYFLYRNLYSSGTYKSLYSKDNRSYDDPLSLLTYIYKKMLVSIANQDQEIIKEIISKFLRDKYIYFHKMALFVLGSRINSLKSYFMNLLEEENLTFFEDYALEDELKNILEGLEPLSEVEKGKLEKKIEKGPNFKIPEARLNNWKQKRYKALDYDNYFKEKNIELKNITHLDVNLVPAVGDVITKWGNGQSPIKKEEILSISNKELAEYINNFQETNHFDGPTIDGLSEELSICSKENPDKFTSDLDVFINSSFTYVYFILYGLLDAWKGKKTIDWGKLIDFSLKYINRKKFWEDELRLQKGYYRDADHKWVINIFSDLIQGGVVDDGWAFEPKYLNTTEKILVLILDNLNEDNNGDEDRDALEKSLNSSWGRTLTSYILLTLRRARIFGRDNTNEDINRFLAKYDSILGTNLTEAYALLGRYIRNFNYLDEQWVKKKIEKDIIYENYECFKSYLEGYLHRNSFVLELYKLMKNHLEKAIQIDFDNEYIENQLIQEICLGYFRDDDKFDGSLLKKVVDFGKTDHIISAIYCFINGVDSIRNEGEPGIHKILYFLRYLFNMRFKNKKEFDEQDKKILSNLSKMIIFLGNIDDENLEWLIVSSKFVTVEHNSPEFIKSLKKYNSSEDIKKIGLIFLEMINSPHLRIMPTYDEEDIIEIVKKINNVDRKIAEKICNKYGENGYDFLRYAI